MTYTITKKRDESSNDVKGGMTNKCGNGKLVAHERMLRVFEGYLNG